MTDGLPLVLKFDDWPQADKTAWDTLFTKGAFLDDDGPAASWSDGTRRMRRQAYGQWLSFLSRHAPDTFDQKPWKRIRKRLVQQYIAECEERLAPKSTANLLSGLYAVACAMKPKHDWAWLNTASKRWSSKAQRHSLSPSLPITAEEVFRWSVNRLEGVEALPELTTKRRAIWARQALMIGFLISRPVRRRALLAMQEASHLVALTEGLNVTFSSADMKDRQERAFPLPRALVEPMKRYLEVHRRVLLAGKSSDYLWINQYGDPITPDGFSRELPRITRYGLGVAMRPHVFRHVAATSIAEFDPVHVNIIRDILGHATLEMAEKHYNRASGISAFSAYQDVIDNMRKELRKTSQRS